MADINKIINHGYVADYTGRRGMTILKTVFHALTLIVALLVSSSSFAADKEKGSVYDRVMSSGKIRCGYAISPPVMLKDPNTGTMSGLDVDIWNEIGKELGLEIEWTQEVGWGSFIEDMRIGRVDAFCSDMWPDPARAKFLSLAGPVIFYFVNAYVRTDDDRFDGDFSKINDPSVKIPAIDGDVTVATIKNAFPKAKIETLPQMSTWSDMLLSVLTKKSDVILTTQSVIDTLDEDNRAKLRKVKGAPPAAVFASYYGVLAGETQLRDMIALALRTIKNDGRLEKMVEQYGYAAPRKDFEE